jgi:hypothetical protein
MPRLRINLRDMTELDELELIDTLDAVSEREEREEREGRGREGRVINPVALQRRQDSRKWGREFARLQRQHKPR